MEMSESAPPNELKTWLFNPFHYIAGGRAIQHGIYQTRLPSTRLLGPVTTTGSRIPTHILPPIKL